MQVTDKMVEAAVRAYNKDQPIEASVCESSRMRSALTAALAHLEAEAVAAWTTLCTGGEVMSRDVAGVEKIAREGSEGPTEVHYLYAAPPASAPAVPSGMVLVPVEPTPEMLGAFWRQKNCGTQQIGDHGPDTDDYSAYRAMLTAAQEGR